MSRAFRLGITGKIGSGKSTLSEIARSKGIRVLEADTIAKDVMNSDPSLRAGIESLFGKEAYINGTLNRGYLASKIFSDESLRLKLEAIVHPVTLQVFEAEFSKAKTGEIIALESAILFQTGLEEIFDAVILVDAKDETVIAREEALGKFKRDDIMNRLKGQNYQADFKQDADFVITNDGSVEDFTKRSMAVIELVTIISQTELPQQPLRMIIE
ncbi:MAG: dephospho-CoA kinase [Bacteroidota bacterium]|nr:dephospho-CoA kinase [Bacteroidota bacterium]MDP4230851.1 dephospho-CoA kinase [Bacteroidota bacterium]